MLGAALEFAGKLLRMVGTYAAPAPAEPHDYRERMAHGALAFAGPQRSAEFPDVPTVAEAGGPKDFEVSGWTAIAAHKGLPKAVADKINADIAKPFAERDIAELREFARSELGLATLEPWDVGYASEKLLQARYAFSAQEVKEYFTEPKVVAGAADQQIEVVGHQRTTLDFGLVNLLSACLFLCGSLLLGRLHFLELGSGGGCGNREAQRVAVRVG